MSYEFAPAGYSLASAKAAHKARQARMAAGVPDEGITSLAELRRRRIAAYEALKAKEEAIRIERSANAFRAAEINLLAASPARIIRMTVARHFGLDVATLISKTRIHKYALARQASYYFMRRFTKLSFPQIGHMFGRDHSTAIHGCEKIENLKATDAAFAANLALLEGEIKAALGVCG